MRQIGQALVLLLCAVCALDYQGATPVQRDAWTQMLPNGVISMTYDTEQFVDESGQQRVEWMVLGHPSSGLSSFQHPFDAISVQIDATSPVEVYWGTGPFVSTPVAVLQRARCGQWLWPFATASTTHCEVVLPKYSYTAPLGRTYLGQSLNAKPSWIQQTLHSVSAMLGQNRPQRQVTVTIKYSTVKDQTGLARLLGGVLVFFLAGALAGSRKVHVGVGGLLGGVGLALVCLYLLTSLLPGKKKVIAFSTLLGLGTTFVGYIRAALTDLFMEYQLFAWAAVAVGMLAGVIVAYKWRLDSDSMYGVYTGLRIIGLGCVLMSSQNIILNVLIMLTLTLFWVFSKEHSMFTMEKSNVRLGTYLPLQREEFDHANNIHYDNESEQDEYIDDMHSDFHDDQSTELQENDDDNDNDDQNESHDKYYPASSNMSPREYEIQGRVYTNLELHRLRNKIRQGEVDITKLSTIALQSIYADLHEHDESDRQWGAETPEEMARAMLHGAAGRRYNTMSFYGNDVRQAAQHIERAQASRPAPYQRPVRRDAAQSTYASEWRQLFNK